MFFKPKAFPSLIANTELEFATHLNIPVLSVVPMIGFIP